MALRVTGRVQGVGFRWFVLTEAVRLGLRGWVRNAPDGSVELEAAGSAQAVAELRRRVERGPPAARVAQVVELAPGHHALPEGFEVVR
ncbi:MAG TPA: acylphosphatase [Longimicrobiales bacterium]